MKYNKTYESYLLLKAYELNLRLSNRIIIVHVFEMTIIILCFLMENLFTTSIIAKL
jgi:hypothetical protein